MNFLPALLVHAALVPADLTNGPITVRINEVGVLLTGPTAGFHTIDGPRADLHPGFAEWFGVSYDAPKGRVEFSGSGTEADWAGRTAVTPASFTATPTAVTAVAFAGDLEVRTVFSFDDPHLIAAITFVNHGTRPITNILYSREWRVAGDGWSFPTDLSLMAPPAPGICRRLWMPDNLDPGESRDVGLSYGTDATWPTGITTGVPIVLWTSPSFPGGLVYGATNGISWGDYDRDGWIDVFCCQSARLWRNLGGTDWQLVGDYDQAPTPLLPTTTYRYGASFGDYDEDGLPDLPTEPRQCCGGDTCFHLLHNLGGGPNFAEVATPTAAIISEPCGLDAETICWGDVDGDADLDLFLPVYPAWAGSAGNFFWTNLGPTGPSGAYHFAETSAASGLDNPLNTARPEGAQFLDVDFDGDIDLYSNGTLYQNKSAPGAIDFDALNTATTTTSGIGFNSQLEEGAAFFDYDLDGDFDLLIVYSSGSLGVRLWENRGDGTFFAGEGTIIQNPLIGLDLGLSAEDWDNDGDIDFTTRQVFRRNQWMETGNRQFTVQPTPNIPASYLTSATPAWGDWDLDGDLDCALGNWLELGRFYLNTTYGPTTPDEDRRFVRVKPLRDSATVAAGLETEFGAVVEIRVAGDPPGRRRKKFTSSAGGYLNQNEYALHFALPPDPDPANGLQDLRFDVVVDFPGPPSLGFPRVDRFVNPVLGRINLADLVDREIQVFRSGTVVINGCSILPSPTPSPVLTTTAGGLVLPTATTAPPAPTAAPTANRFVGLAFDTLGGTPPIRVKELFLDGQLDAAVDCAGVPANVVLWDTTDAASEFVAQSLSFTTSIRNRRHWIPVSWVLKPGRQYRLVARVTQLRGTTIAGPIVQGSLTIHGGLNYEDADPCSPVALAAATVDATKAYLGFRFANDTGAAWVDLGGGVAGTYGIPELAATGPLQAGQNFTLDLSNALEGALAGFGVGLSAECLPLVGTKSIPALDYCIPNLYTGPAGTLSYPLQWPVTLPPGFAVLFQGWTFDLAGPEAYAASNAIAGILQP